jgi:YD repeat-containing protein
MKRNPTFFIFLLLCFWVIKSRAQESNKLPKDFTVHSPNTTSLGEYGVYPVNLSTGVPQVNIPLYTVTSGKLSVPISLSYHASGIKVDQESSLVGLGWVLNAGGLITRTLKDRDDMDNASGFITKGQSLPDFNSIYNVNGAGGIENNAALVTLFDYFDKEPDLFNVSAPGITDEFCLDNRGKFVSTGLDSLKYLYDNNQNKQLITVTDRAGNTYRFGRGLDNSDAFETTSQRSTSDGVSYFGYPTYTSSWYLTEIISADQADTISFKYKKGVSLLNKVVNSVRYILNSNDLTLSPMDETGRVFDQLYHVRLDSSTDLLVLDKILFKTGSIEFSTVRDRLDITDRLSGSSFGPGTRVTGFTIYDDRKNIIRSVAFDNNNYFDRTGNGLDILGYTNISDLQRKKSLKLNGVKFFDKSGIFNNEYKFQYDSTPLPARGTTAQDFWGYYNGKLNSLMIPKTFFFTNNGRPGYYGGDRKTDFNYMKAASLKQITFPTGGYTTYEYEPNYYLNESSAQNQIRLTKTINAFAINRLSSCRPNYLPGVPANNSVDFKVTNIAPITSGTLPHLYVMFSDFVSQGYQKMTFDLWETDGAGNIGVNVAHFERIPSSSTQPLVFNQDIMLYEGRNYRMELKTNDVTNSQVSLCNSPYIEAGINYDYLETSTETQVAVDQAGGLRVKSVSNFDNNNTLISKKGYEYGEGVYGANAVGVGKLITDPSKNFYNYPLLYKDLSSNSTLKNVLWFTSNSQVELGMNSGCPVDYNKVTVTDIYFDGSRPNGKTEYYYQSMDGYHEPRSSFMYPYDFIVRPFWTVSNLVKTVYYSSAGNGNYVPLKEVEDQYDMIEKRIKTLKLFEYQPDIWMGWSGGGSGYLFNNPNRFYRYNYFQARGKALKKKEVIKDYINNGTDSIVTEKIFDYNPYYDLKSESYVDSKSRSVQTNYKYTGDIDYTNLISINAVSLPVQTEQIIAGKVRNGNILKYNDLAQLTDDYLALSNSTPANYISAATIPSYYEKRTKYEYDTEYRTIKSVALENSVPTIYIWSYKGQYPVAVIKNSTYAAVEAALGGSVSVSNFRKSNPTNAQVNAFLNVLRTALPAAQTTTYTYDPLTGMTSSTDAKGETTYYEYDGFQRLINIRDKGLNIIKHTDYHYQNQ